MKEIDDKTIEWYLQDDHKEDEKGDEISFQLSGQHTFMELEEQLRKNIEKVEEIKFIDYDNSEIGKTNRMENIGWLFSVQLDGQSCPLVNDSVYPLQHYNQLQHFCQDIHLPLLQKNTVLAYLKKVDQILHNKHNVKVFDDQHNNQCKPLPKQSVYLALLEGLISRTGINKTSETILFDNYMETLKKVEEQKGMYEALETGAHRRAKRKLSLGLVALIGQFYLAGYGTYVAYSWDIMEPIIYFVNLTFTIAFSYQFFNLKDECTPHTLYHYLKDKEIQHLAQSTRFDLQAYQALQQQLHHLEAKIKMNVIGTL